MAWQCPVTADRNGPAPPPPLERHGAANRGLRAGQPAQKHPRKHFVGGGATADAGPLKAQNVPVAAPPPSVFAVGRPRHVA
eukprot:CAMPEP_0174318668 /NCGR_PEP_ID=MMETSP0810-20121108/8363_1 /TAXON_ID=73025 ORGANISM="Eutreptiella gymnastica-like, Strain CCMP1594" /NCGR_SAMPLE_ID=MMETSP0810 /ASSEMBLY_ACC=CAM_ASM_000659 /LENGTH=80 /DNA_ID=CAMNT_0015428977 /DNA_START=2215 /DNA_END=2454 /DNA_ORIENTATION=+